MHGFSLDATKFQRHVRLTDDSHLDKNVQSDV